MAPTEAQILEGRYGQINYEYTLWRSDNQATKIEDLSANVDSASFTMDNFRDHTWELQLPMRAAEELDIFNDWVLLEVTAEAAGYSFTKPFGLYFFEAPKGEDSPMVENWDLTGKSPEARLMGSTAQFGYAAVEGTGILAAVRAILLAQGVPARMMNLRAIDEDKVLTSTFFADPFQDAEGTRWLRICNALLAAGGFLALFADNSGVLTTRQIRTLNTYEPEITYGTTADSDQMIISETIPYEYDDENFANRIVVQSGDPSTAASIGVAENHDPNSRVSYEHYGKWVQPDPVVLPNLVSAAEAQMVAKQMLRAASGMNHTKNFETNFDTRTKPRQVYGLEIFRDDGSAVTTGIEWPVVNVGATLDLSGMTHTVHHGVRL